MGEKNSINKRCKLTRPVMSPAKIIGDWGNVRDNLQSLKYQQPQQFWGKEKAYSKWIIITWITSISFFFSPFTEVMIPIRGIIRFICFSTFSVTVSSCLCWVNLFGTLTYFQEKNLCKKIPCREGSLPPHSYPPRCSLLALRYLHHLCSVSTMFLAYSSWACFLKDKHMFSYFPSLLSKR